VNGFGEQDFQTSGAVPADACTLFGPDTPAPKPGEAPFRPHDPDVTGGYYLPVRVDLQGADTTIALERIRCNLSGASPEVAADFRTRYVPNNSPTLVSVTAQVNGSDVGLDALPTGAKITFRATWTGADDPAPSAENYVVYDIKTDSILDKRESLRVSWYATAGEFASDSTGRGEDEQESFTEDDWTAPTAAGPLKLWVVLRDSRGGVDYQALDATVVAH
jgi:hypothetical protein